MSTDTKQGKVALITGAGSGIGRATALRLLEHGYRVVLTGRRKELLDEVADTARQHGQNALAVPCDVSDETSVAALFDAIRLRYDRLDVLFNNAGRNAPPVDIDEISVDEWRSVVDTNLTGVFLCTRAAFGMMKAQSPRGGRIINNGSEARDHGADEIRVARRAPSRHRLRTDRYRQRRDGHGRENGAWRAAGERRNRRRAADGRRTRRRCGAAYGGSAAGGEHTVHDDHGEQDAVRRPRIAPRG